MQLPKLRRINPNQPKKKKILLLSDDLRLHSGIGTMSREFVIGTAHKYDWVQLGAAIKHPEEGKIVDMSDEVNRLAEIDDAYVRIYPSSGYGNAATLFQLLDMEKPDLIIHFTDPRFWGWLYEIEDQIRSRVPLVYYNIWDDLPYPHWNEDAYESCDMLMNISRQTQNIVKNVLQRNPKPDWAVQYVPHGVNHKHFRPIDALDPDYAEFKQFEDNFRLRHGADFIVFWNNRNIKRKQPGDVVLAYKQFCDSLPAEKAARCVLLLHTQPVDDNGTDLYAVVRAVCPSYTVVFSHTQVSTKQLNFYYNIADVTLNIASNEGFGISSLESIMAGTMIINNVTGGLQDQMRFADEAGNWIEFDDEFPSNHAGKFSQTGPWAVPVFPSNRSLQGSPLTPYIFDDRVSTEDVAEAIRHVYDLDSDTRDAYGIKGRTWAMSDESNMSAENMSKRFIECFETCFENWTPRPRVHLLKVTPTPQIEKIGIV